MSVLDSVLQEEYERSCRLSTLIEFELRTLPKGSLRARKIRGNTYYYLNHREGKRVVSDYVARGRVDVLREQIERRRSLQAALKEQLSVQKRLRKVLGKAVLDE